MPVLDFTSTYILAAINEERRPEKHFIRDTYFPTGEGDIYKADKVLTEYREGSRKLAPFLAPKASAINVDRPGYSIREYTPPLIKLSRTLTVDDLEKRGFGEAIYSNTTPAERAKRLLAEDLGELDAFISRTEEWMCAQTMLNNGCTLQTYIDGKAQGEPEVLEFFSGTSNHEYTVAADRKWDGTNANILGDGRAMANMLVRRGLPAADMIVGTDVSDVILANKEIRELLNRNSGIRIGDKLEELLAFPGVTFLGTLNFGGNELRIIQYSGTYEADDGSDIAYFPAKDVVVTAPGAGRLAYAQITQMDKSEQFETFAERRVPRYFADRKHNIRELELSARPLAAPRRATPWIHATDVIS